MEGIMKEPIFETQRMKVRPWTDGDAPALFKYASDPDVGVRAGWPPHKSIEESRSVIKDIFSNGHTWALELKDTGEAIGCIGYYDWKESNIGIGQEDAELGYWLAKPYWNRGLGTEAVRGMVDYCFNKKGYQTELMTRTEFEEEIGYEESLPPEDIEETEEIIMDLTDEEIQEIFDMVKMG